MMMLFWSMTALMVLVALFTVLPWIPSKKLKTFICLFISTFSYGLYLHYGYASKIHDYYASENRQARAKLLEIRPLVAILSKHEIKLRMRLEEVPEDRMAKCQLWDVLAIRALQGGDPNLADRYWEEALKNLPNSPEAQALRVRIINLKENVKDFSKN